VFVKSANGDVQGGESDGVSGSDAFAAVTPETDRASESPSGEEAS